jgi:hypothetical protein
VGRASPDVDRPGRAEARGVGHRDRGRPRDRGGGDTDLVF